MRLFIIILFLIGLKLNVELHYSSIYPVSINHNFFEINQIKR